MYYRLLKLEFKSFFRSPQFSTNLVMKILKGFGILYFLVVLLFLPLMVFFLAKEHFKIPPVDLLSKYFLYYMLFDLMLRYFVQSLSKQNIKPFLTLNINKTKIVKYSFLKSCLHFINLGSFLFILIFSIALLFDDNNVWQILMFGIGLFSVLIFNNFLNILLNKNNYVFYTILSILALFVSLEYFKYIQLSDYSLPIFTSFYKVTGLFILPVLATIVIAIITFKYIKSQFYLDKGFEVERTEAKTENVDFLNRFGVVGTFINNDIRLIKRNKMPRKVFFTGVLFIFYGLITFMKGYDSIYMKMVVSFLVTGSFMMNFGARVPAWDSQHYPLMMTMNVPYKAYLNAKWYSLFVMTALMIVLALPYALIGWDFYAMIFSAGIFNLGVNVHLTLLQGSFNKAPVDLNGKTKQLNKGGFSFIGLFLGFIKIIFPIGLFAIINYFIGFNIAILSVIICGFIGLFTKDKVLNSIVKRYKTQKYKTLESFKKGL